jgi:hypothetical protein
LKSLLKNKIVYFFIFMIVSACGFLWQKTIVNAVPNDTIEIYHFYHPPFGVTCSKAENYIQEVIKNDFKNVSFKSVNTEQTPCDQFIKDCPCNQKEVVIFNKSKNEFLISSLRSLIKQGKAKEEIQNTLITELKSIL